MQELNQQLKQIKERFYLLGDYYYLLKEGNGNPLTKASNFTNSNNNHMNLKFNSIKKS